MSAASEQLERLEMQLAQVQAGINRLRAASAAPGKAAGGMVRGRARAAVARIALALALVAFPITVLASDTFTDVPTSNSFHASINTLFGSRITTGCSPTTYCPDSAVTRGQMAAFLTRGLGRVGYRAAPINGDLTGPGNVELNSIQLKVGGVLGGYGMLKVDASVVMNVTDVTNCPCEGYFWLSIDGIGSSNTVHPHVDSLIGAGIGRDYAPITWAVRVPSGATITVKLIGTMLGGSADTGEITGAGDLTVLYLPFDAFGTNNDPAQTGP